MTVDQINELNALVSLIDEPNMEMFGTIREKVLKYGVTAIPALEEAWVNTLGEDDSERIEELIEDIRRNDLSENFTFWLNDEAPCIIDAYVFLMHYLKPDFDEDSFRSLYEKLYREIWLELNENLTSLEKVKVFNHVIYHVNNISGTSGNTSRSDTYYLSYLDYNKTGSPIMLGSLYISLAKKLNLPIFGVDLPGNFVLAYMNDPHMEKRISEYNADDVLFYINPGNEGAVFTHNEIRHYIKHMNYDNSPGFFLPASNKIVMARVIGELALLHENENSLVKRDGLEIIAEILNKF